MGGYSWFPCQTASTLFPVRSAPKPGRGKLADAREERVEANPGLRRQTRQKVEYSKYSQCTQQQAIPSPPLLLAE